jgi:hypothetical protein
MMDTMGFSAEMGAAYQSYFIAKEPGVSERKRDDKGGIADVKRATQNLELTKEWLERMK